MTSVPAEAKRVSSWLPSRTRQPNSSRFPDFFIVGAPKCGTTALYSYLRAHPSIFMPKQKEPYYFCSDFPGVQRIRCESEYLALFAHAPRGSLLGEASVWYLNSAVAIPEILSANARARFIVMIRNPVDMAYSLHAQHLRAHQEDVDDFELAWRLQEVRASGQRLPPFCKEPSHLQYRSVCSLSWQLARMFEYAAEDQVLVILFDEFARSTRLCYLRTLRFLGLEDDRRSDFSIINENNVPRWRKLGDLLAAKPFPIDYIYQPSRRLANSIGLRPGRLLGQLNRRPERRRPLDPNFRQHLASEFDHDTAQLERLLNRRLSWRQ